jgi:hypothetical protein
MQPFFAPHSPDWRLTAFGMFSICSIFLLCSYEREAGRNGRFDERSAKGAP